MKLPTPRELDKAGGDAWKLLDSIESDLLLAVPASEQDAVDTRRTLARLRKLRDSYFGEAVT